MKPVVSVILPTFNEVKTGWLPAILAVFKSLEDDARFEFIAVDGNSCDGTKEFLCEVQNMEVVDLEESATRAKKLNTGIKKASGDIILCHHPRSLLDKTALLSLLELKNKKVWGGFTHQFDQSHPLLKFTSWYSNKIRAKRGVLYLDHCIFFHKDLFVNDSIPDVSIFEDTELSRIFCKRVGRPVVLSGISETSAIRFVKNGILKQGMTNQFLKLSYHLGISDLKMNRFYEKRTSLNNSYKVKS